MLYNPNALTDGSAHKRLASITSVFGVVRRKSWEELVPDLAAYAKELCAGEAAMLEGLLALTEADYDRLWPIALGAESTAREAGGAALQLVARARMFDMHPEKNYTDIRRLHMAISRDAGASYMCSVYIHRVPWREAYEGLRSHGKVWGERYLQYGTFIAAVTDSPHATY
jgi:hypothetical protein